MNRHCGSVLTLVAALLLAPALGIPAAAETLIDQLYAQRQFDLADAYWLAGQKFTELGQKERGAEFQAKAKHLFPGYVAGKAPEFAVVPEAQAIAVAAVPETPRMPDVTVVREQNLQGEKIAKLAWNKLLRGFLNSNADTIASVLADKLTLPREGNPEVLATAGMTTQIEAFFQDHVLDVSAPADLYDLASMKSSEGTEPGSVVLTVAAQPEAPAELETLLPFWKPVQQFTFVRSGDTWKLAAISGE